MSGWEKRLKVWEWISFLELLEIRFHSMMMAVSEVLLQETLELRKMGNTRKTFKQESKLM